MPQFVETAIPAISQPLGVYDYPLPWLYRSCRDAVRMARAYHGNPRLRVSWQERAADYRETIIDKMRRRQGWTLAERVAGSRSQEG